MKIMKKCPPGVVCIENMTLAFIVICLFLLSYFIYNLVRTPISTSTNVTLDNHLTEKVVIQESSRRRPVLNPGISWLPNYPYNNLDGGPGDVLLDPYAPPLNDERYLVPIPTRPIMPINISTNIGAVDTNYRQVGILTTLNTKGRILSLMGRPLFVNRDKWQYYTISDQHNNVKLPVSRAGRSCTNEYGCDKLYNGDTIFVEGYNEAFKVTIYDNDVIKYL
jgi:hypothetical protein